MATAVGVPRSAGGRALARLGVIAFMLALVAMGLPSSNLSFAASGTTDQVTILDAKISNHKIEGADVDHPIVLSSDVDTPFSMRLRNNTDQPIDVEFARLEGRSLGVAFLHYDMALKTTMPAHSIESFNGTLNFYSLDRAATGYLQAALRIFNHETHAVGQQKFVVDVKGKPLSQVGLVTLELTLLAIAGITEIIVRFFRNSLPRNRFLRALFFAFTGSVLALAITVGTAAFRIALLPAHTWVPLLFFSTVIGFALGYIAPGPTSGAAEEDRSTLDLVAAEAVARASGQHTGEVAPTDVAFSSGDHSAVRLVGPPSRDDLPAAHHDSGRHDSGRHDSGRHDSGRQQPAGDTPTTER